MKKLLKSYGLNSDMQYYELIVDSVINGQRTQAKEQFKAMSKKERKQFVKSVLTDWNTPLDPRDKMMFFDLL